MDGVVHIRAIILDVVTTIFAETVPLLKIVMVILVFHGMDAMCVRSHFQKRTRVLLLPVHWEKSVAMVPALA